MADAYVSITDPITNPPSLLCMVTTLVGRQVTQEISVATGRKLHAELELALGTIDRTQEEA